MKLLPIKLCAMATVLSATTAHADIASVNYVHKYVTKVWNITVPTTAADSNVVSMKYLMSVVDAANAALNGMPTTDYAADPSRATSNIASTAAARDAIDNLIKQEKIEYKFFFTPATTNNEYYFSISAAGTYYIDWGDGQFETITKDSVGAEDIKHTYADSANTYEIKLGGKATAYSSTYNVAAISFMGADKGPSKISGCLGCIFSTLDSGTERQPRFYQTFYTNTALTSNIPEELFSGITGAPVSYMFYMTFANDWRIGGAIPAGLFAGIKGMPAAHMFNNTFSFCRGLEESIPEDLFAGIEGAPAAQMFNSTFYYCDGLRGEIPENLFAGITPTGEYKFNMFYNTFYSCRFLTGYSPKINGQYLYEIWPDVSTQNTYSDDTKLSDYDCIPKAWGGGGTKNQGECD